MPSKAAVANPDKAAAIKVYLTTLDKAYVWAAAHPSAWATAWGKAAGLPLWRLVDQAGMEQHRPQPVGGFGNRILRFQPAGAVAGLGVAQVPACNVQIVTTDLVGGDAEHRCCPGEQRPLVLANALRVAETSGC